MDLGLHLDDQQPAGPWIECEHVNPTRPAAALDLDLGRDQPAIRPKTRRDVGDASGMDSVALHDPVREERGLERESDASAKGAPDAIHSREVDRTRDAALEPRDHGLRNSRPLLDIALSEAKRSTRVSEDPAGTYGEGRTERCHAVRDSRRSFASAYRLILGRLPIGDRRA
jgi:hypothetical protein